MRLTTSRYGIPGILCNLVELKKFTRYLLSLAWLTTSAMDSKVFQEYYVTWYVESSKNIHITDHNTCNDKVTYLQIGLHSCKNYWWFYQLDWQLQEMQNVGKTDALSNISVMPMFSFGRAIPHSNEYENRLIYCFITYNKTQGSSYTPKYNSTAKKH